MLIYLRKAYPYYGKYKFKIEIKYEPFNIFRKQIVDWCVNNLVNKIDYNYSGFNSIYLKDKKIFNQIQKKFGEYIYAVHKPAPGYENLEGRGKIDEQRILWYNRFPFKIVLLVTTRNEWHDIFTWCDENIKYDFKKTIGSYNKINWFFVSKFDAVAFKLAYGDKVIETFESDSNNVKKVLEERVLVAQQDLDNFLEGEV